MPKFSSAYVTISGKVFIGEDEMHEALSLKDPANCKWNEDEAEWEDNTTAAQRREVFEELAMQQISALFPSDMPMKHGDISIDMDSYKCP